MSPALREAAEKAWHLIDWLPARMTAMAFAVVGSFEEAIDCWRNHAQRFPDDNDGVVLAATFTVLGIIPLVALAEIAFAVAFGVLLDTLVVRSLLVPALVHIIGKRIWWPAKLED